MINIRQNIAMSSYTSLRLGGLARFFVEINSRTDLIKALNYAKSKQLAIYILGGGTNIIVSDHGFDGFVIKINNKGLEVIEDNNRSRKIIVASGELWDDVVKYAVDNNLWGVENMSIVPGKMGAYSVQNVGCYGQEASDVVECVIVLDIESLQVKSLSAKECKFSYRQSVFNKQARGRYVILETEICLKKNGSPNLSYPDVAKHFNRKKITQPTLHQIREAIISIRTGKFADPKNIGTAGSFFKNKNLTREEFDSLKKRLKPIISATIQAKLDKLEKKFAFGKIIKFPTAFIIDQVLHLKGTRQGGAILSEKQADAILNPDSAATAADVLTLMKIIRSKIYEVSGLKIEFEPQLVGFTEQELRKLYQLN